MRAFELCIFASLDHNRSDVTRHNQLWHRDTGGMWDQQIRNLILVPGNEWISALSKLESITISIVLLFHINSLSSKH